MLMSQDVVNVNCKDENGRTLLSHAMSALSEETLDYILTLIRDKGADPNIPDAKGNTPLMYLVEKIL